MDTVLELSAAGSLKTEARKTTVRFPVDSSGQARPATAPSVPFPSGAVTEPASDSESDVAIYFLSNLFWNH